MQPFLDKLLLSSILPHGVQGTAFHLSLVPVQMLTHCSSHERSDLASHGFYVEKVVIRSETSIQRRKSGPWKMSTYSGMEKILRDRLALKNLP